MKEALRVHRDRATAEHQFYLTHCLASQDTSDTVHLTFDFAQSVHLPYFTRQPGSYYFKVGLVVRIFGIACETSNTQMNYLLPEESYPADSRGGGKGANLVLSRLDHRLGAADVLGKHPQLHADSCSGQSKNKYVFYYCIWRVVIGFNPSIQLYFMVPGHTKCYMDQMFGCIKRNMAKQDNLSVCDLVATVNESAHANVATDCSNGNVNFYDWKRFLLQFFSAAGVPGIKKSVAGMVVTTAVGGGVVVKLKRTSSDDGSVWDSFLARERDCNDVANKNNVENFQQYPLRMTKSIQKYLLNLVDAYYDESNVGTAKKVEFFNMENFDQLSLLREGLKDVSDKYEDETSKKRKRS